LFLAGAALTLATAYALGLLIFRKASLPAVLLLGLGAIALSLEVFLLLLLGLPVWIVFLQPLLALPFLKTPKFEEPPSKPLDAISRCIVYAIFAFYGIFYLVHAMAPEIQPDAISYHLGLVAEYVRLGTFPHRVGFYEVLPQGMEMLYTTAFAVGRHSAAKLVHFAFFLATLPLIVLTARRLKLPDLTGYAAAALYFAAPVAGLSGSCAYTDAAQVFFTLAAFYLLLLWRHAGLLSYAFAAGLTAGFCYAIKFPGLLVPPLALVFILVCRRDTLRSVLCLIGGTLLVIGPWMLRAYLLAHNPVAPLFNSLFPNAFFNAGTDAVLARHIAVYSGFQWTRALWDWGFSGRAQGVMGPLILLAPLGLLALRKPAGRLLLLAGLLLCAPVAFNVGSRFVMPALPFFALALALALPRPAVWACAILQAVICLPMIIERFEQPQSWTLRGFPWRAALRLESESDYLKSAATGDYLVAQLVETSTPPTARVLCLFPIAKAYVTRDVLESWHTNQAQQLTATLYAPLDRAAIDRVHADWPAAPLRRIRIVSMEDLPIPWRVFEVRFNSPGGPIFSSPQWSLDASPNRWESPRAFDGNRASAWSTLAPRRRGMFLQVDFERPQLLNAVDMTMERNYQVPMFLVQAQADGSPKWRTLADAFQTELLHREGLRYEAMFALKSAGFTHILASTDAGGLGVIGADLVKHANEWGVKNEGAIGQVHLLRID
jgi:hypothetical protein